MKMASRLTQRCCRLLAASLIAPVTTPGCALVSRNVLPRTLSLSTVHTSCLCRHTDPSLAQEQVYRRLPDRTEIDGLIAAATGVDELLQISVAHPVSGNEAALIAISLARHGAGKKLEVGDIVNDDRCQQLLQATEKQISHVWNGNLVNLLRSLYLLGLHGEDRVLRSVENEVRWRLRRLTFKQLVVLADFCVPFSHTPEQKVLVSDLVKHLELRWAEIEDARTVVILMTKMGYISRFLMEKLEDKALEYAEHFSPDETRRLLLALASQKRRCVPLLRALSYHLVQWHFELGTSILLDVAFAFGKLNFQQAQVFQKMATDLLPRVPEMTPGDVTRCVKSFAYLKWLNLPLFEAITEHVVKNADEFTGLQLCNILLAFARLNYQPSKGEDFFGLIHQKLLAEIDNLDVYLQIDLVWSLCVLQQMKDVYLQKVLRPEFYSIILDDQSPKSRNYRLKLLNINSSAQLDCVGYPGPLICVDALHAEVSAPSDRKLTPLQSGVGEALKSVVGDEACVRHDVLTVYGWQMDGEVVLDSDSKPLRLIDLEAPHLPKSTGKKPLPPGSQRLAFLCWDFLKFCLKSKDLLGRWAMSRRHLQSAGFLIVDVPYYEWLDLKSDWQKVAYLKDKMGKAVAEEMAK